MFKNKPKARKSNIVVQKIDDELFVYDLNNDQVFCLNKTSNLVWNFCDGENSVSAICDLLSEELKSFVSEDFLWLAISELNKNNLLENGKPFENHFSKVNRREIIKRIGLASMVALPLISTVIAPTAVNAGSCIGGVTFPVPPGGNPPNVFANVNPFPLADNTTGCGQCQDQLKPQCCSGNVTNFSCSPAFPATSYNCNALCV